MRLTALLLFLIAANLHAAAPATAAPAAALPGVYKQYVAPATRTPTPVPGAVNVTRIEVHKDTMSLLLKGGAAMPIGDMAANNTAGYSAGGELVYGASSIIDAAFFAEYASMPYKLTMSSKPHTSMGAGIKAVVKILSDEKLSVNFSGGLGYFFENFATASYKGADPVTGEKLYDTVYKAAGGLGFVLGIGAGIQFTPHLAVLANAEAVQVSLSGGTGDTPMFLLPTLNLKYTF